MIKIFNKQKGFTLIEIIVSIGILSLIFVAWGVLQADIFSLNRFIYIGLNNQYEAKKIVRPFAGEVRAAVSSATGSYLIEEATPTSFTFYSNIDGDPQIERVRYFLENKTFKKSITKPSGQLSVYDTADEKFSQVVHHVVSPDIFTYYDSSYNGTDSVAPLAAPIDISQIRLVKVRLEIDDDPAKPPAPITVETQVSIRNLKNNY